MAKLNSQNLHDIEYLLRTSIKQRWQYLGISTDRIVSILLTLAPDIARVNVDSSTLQEDERKKAIREETKRIRAYCEREYEKLRTERHQKDQSGISS